MAKNNPDHRFDQLVRLSLIPKGHRPRTDAEIEQLLGLIDAPAISDDKLQRMLRKINGEEPVFVQDAAPDTQAGVQELTAVEREMVALHRAEGKELPPELAAKLRAMEERASRPPDEEVDTGE